jgi:hypothetical protein
VQPVAGFVARHDTGVPPMTLQRWGVMAALAIAVFCGCAQRAHAQAAEPQPEPSREELQLQISIMRDYIKKLQDSGQPKPATAEPALSPDVDPQVLRAYNDAQLKQYQSLVQQADLINQSFYEQRIILRTSLFLVALVVIAGVSFSAVQLWQGVGVAGKPLSNELEISASKVRLTSSVIGVVVLAISLAFFYVFVSGSLKVERASAPNATAQAAK